MVRFERYVAIGDSSTEGWIDPDGEGGFRGWANRLAERIAADQRSEGGLLYANLGVRGKRTREIVDEQLRPALAMRPDLVTFFSGTNDVIARRFDPDGLARDLESAHREIRATGATLLTFTLPDLVPVMPLARLLSARLEQLNDAVRRISAASGALLVDFAAHPLASDPRLWDPDRLHANPEGHARIAAALAHALGLPETGESAGTSRESAGTWAEPLPPLPVRGPVSALRDEAVWVRRYLLPWLLFRLRGDREAAPRTAKRPLLLPVDLASAGPAARSLRRGIYVDTLLRYSSNRRFPWRESCHLFADSPDELHVFAAEIGMRREWFQIGNKGVPHYDLNAERRELAVRLGAVELSRRDSVAKWREIRGSVRQVPGTESLPSSSPRVGSPPGDPVESPTR